jgi:hypothetical protein
MIQFNILFKSHLSITGHNTQIKQSYNNKLESHSLQNYKETIIKTLSIAQIYKTILYQYITYIIQNQQYLQLKHFFFHLKLNYGFWHISLSY